MDPAKGQTTRQSRIQRINSQWHELARNTPINPSNLGFNIFQIIVFNLTISAVFIEIFSAKSWLFIDRHSTPPAALL